MTETISQSTSAPIVLTLHLDSTRQGERLQYMDLWGTLQTLTDSVIKSHFIPSLTEF